MAEQKDILFLLTIMDLLQSKKKLLLITLNNKYKQECKNYLSDLN